MISPIGREKITTFTMGKIHREKFKTSSFGKIPGEKITIPSQWEKIPREKNYNLPIGKNPP
jgi:hypothetical protein